MSTRYSRYSTTESDSVRGNSSRIDDESGETVAEAPQKRSRSVRDSSERGGRLNIASSCTSCRDRKIKCNSGHPCSNCSDPDFCIYPIKRPPGFKAGEGPNTRVRLNSFEEHLREHEARLVEQESKIRTLEARLSTIQAPLSLPIPVNSTPVIALQASPTNVSSLPPDHVISDLVDLYFLHIHPWAPFVPPIRSYYYSPWSIVAYAMVVSSLRFSSDPTIAANRELFKQTAKDKVILHAAQNTTMESVQALTILALDLIGSDLGPSSWGILDMLFRSAVRMGLTQEDETPDSAKALGSKAPAPYLESAKLSKAAGTWEQDEASRRLFWIIFCLDRYAAVSTGCDFAFPTFDIKRRLPCADLLWSQPIWQSTPQFRSVLHGEAQGSDVSLSPLTFLVQAMDILARSHTLHSERLSQGDTRSIEARKDSTSTLTTAALRWHSNLPSLPTTGLSVTTVSPARQNFPSIDDKHAIHYATLLKLNAYYAFPALSNGDAQQPYASICLSSARDMLVLVQSVRGLDWRSISTPWFIWCCWVAARVFFIHAFVVKSTSPGHEFDEMLAALKSQSHYWSLAELFTKRLTNARDGWIPPGPNPEGAYIPQAVHALLDLHRPAWSALQREDTDESGNVDLTTLPDWAFVDDLGNWLA